MPLPGLMSVQAVLDSLIDSYHDVRPYDILDFSICL